MKKLNLLLNQKESVKETLFVTAIMALITAFSILL